MTKKRGDSSKMEVLLTFLQRTKEGKYAPIDDVSLEYIHYEVRREELEDCEQYYYSLS